MRVDDNQRQSKITSARNLIYEKNYAVDSAAIQRLLKEKSLVPTVVGIYSHFFDNDAIVIPQNAFSARLAAFGLNQFSLFVVDLMHEVEIGIWRALLIHLLRILDCIDASLLTELDRR